MTCGSRAKIIQQARFVLTCDQGQDKKFVGLRLGVASKTAVKWSRGAS